MATDKDRSTSILDEQSRWHEPKQGLPDTCEAMKRRIFVFGAVVSLVALGLFLHAPIRRMGMRQVLQGVDGSSLLQDGSLHVFVTGSGTPAAQEDRAGAGVLVVAGDRVIVVDAGPGSVRSAAVHETPINKTEVLLLTHLHSDHITDIPDLMAETRVMGARSKALTVVGPVGTLEVVRGFEDGMKYDRQRRARNLPDNYHVTPPADVSEVDLGTSGSKVVYDKDALKITSFGVDHHKIPAVGYRIDYGGRSVVISGDTRKSSNLQGHAKNADILIHEAYSETLVDELHAAAVDVGRQDMAEQFVVMRPYHTPVREVVSIAQEAHVKTLVLTHMIPGPQGWYQEQIFMDGQAGNFDGELILARDGLHLELEPH